MLIAQAAGPWRGGKLPQAPQCRRGPAIPQNDFFLSPFRTNEKAGPRAPNWLSTGLSIRFPVRARLNALHTPAWVIIWMQSTNSWRGRFLIYEGDTQKSIAYGQPALLYCMHMPWHGRVSEVVNFSSVVDYIDVNAQFHVLLTLAVMWCVMQYCRAFSHEDDGLLVFTARRYASLAYAMALCSSVHPFVTSGYCIETTERIELVFLA